LASRRGSADYRYVERQLQRAHKQVSIPGLNTNHNHDLKNLFKGAAIVAANTQAACGFRYWASKRAPFFQTCKVIAAILRASVKDALGQ